jgi:hypothetical protein
MASIERTAYPRFKKMLTRAELNQHYQPSDKELAFVRRYAKGNQQQLTLMALLKSQQNLGYGGSVGIRVKSSHIPSFFSQQPIGAPS